MPLESFPLGQLRPSLESTCSGHCKAGAALGPVRTEPGRQWGTPWAQGLGLAPLWVGQQAPLLGLAFPVGHDFWEVAETLFFFFF